MDVRQIDKSILLNLFHLNSYAIAFNDVNQELDAIQQRHFLAAGKDVLSLRDEFVLYEAGKHNQTKILELCGAKGENDIYQMLNLETQDTVLIDDWAWLISAINNAITYYNERYVFFMLDDEYADDLETTLGSTRKKAMLRELHNVLNKRLVCGSADDAKYALTSFLSEHGETYQKPQAPYLAKHDARFARFRQSIRDLIAQEQQA